MSDRIKTGQPVPLWYEVVVEFSNDYITVREQWNGKEFADRAVKAWEEIVEADRETGETYTVDITVVPKYTPRKD